MFSKTAYTSSDPGVETPPFRRANDSTAELMPATGDPLSAHPSKMDPVPGDVLANLAGPSFSLHFCLGGLRADEACRHCQAAALRSAPPISPYVPLFVVPLNASAVRCLACRQPFGRQIPVVVGFGESLTEHMSCFIAGVLSEPCPTCEDSVCMGCTKGTSDSRRDRDEAIRVDLWRARREALQP